MIKFCGAEPMGWVVAKKQPGGRPPEAAMLANGAYAEMMWCLRNPDSMLPAEQRHRLTDELRVRIRRLADEVAVEVEDPRSIVDHVPRVRAAYDRARVLLSTLP